MSTDRQTHSPPHSWQLLRSGKRLQDIKARTAELRAVNETCHRLQFGVVVSLNLISSCAVRTSWVLGSRLAGMHHSFVIRHNTSRVVATQHAKQQGRRGFVAGVVCHAWTAFRGERRCKISSCEAYFSTSSAQNHKLNSWLP